MIESSKLDPTTPFMVVGVMYTTKAKYVLIFEIKVDVQKGVSFGDIFDNRSVSFLQFKFS